MAKAISRIKRMEMTQEQIRAKKVSNLEAKMADNAESIEKAIDLIRTLDEAGTLDTLNAFVKHKEDALGHFVTEANKPRYSKTFENLFEFVFLMGDLDVQKVRELSQRLNQGLEGMEEGSELDEKTSMMDLMKALKDPEINQGITMMLHFIRGLGKRN
ncbi:DUF1641 domain-containing protein [Pontibacillus sp. HMF3514]|uniref:DUF1641 domain-containing protein n=1 Tax=Pontibacillus sp. HMF3514 TaxID=2692425 RepID=UPI00131F7D0C|nr:DUF1641 domain-containing protein [Pontibacillus sp. HMF3514]QHE51912.1 DUF1641 domain-containing protein [Pontibacillus sp. HMF3514]